MGVFLLGLAAGEVLFAEVLVTPTGVSKGCGCVTIDIPPFTHRSNKSFRIVEFASHEDSQRAIRELSEQALLGRPVFIREVSLPPPSVSQFLLKSITGPRKRSSIWCHARSR